MNGKVFKTELFSHVLYISSHIKGFRQRHNSYYTAEFISISLPFPRGVRIGKHNSLEKFGEWSLKRVFCRESDVVRIACGIPELTFHEWFWIWEEDYEDIALVELSLNVQQTHRVHQPETNNHTVYNWNWTVQR